MVPVSSLREKTRAVRRPPKQLSAEEEADLPKEVRQA
jgi:hypothetical protein